VTVGRSGIKGKRAPAVGWAALDGNGWAALGHAQAREREPGWADGGVSAQGHFSGLKHFLFSKLFSNLQIILNSTQI
jgi:hypothetical protein